MALLIALVIVTIVALARRLPPGRPAHAGDAALQTVRMGYARGEMERDEFLRVSSDLAVMPPAPVANQGP